MQYSQHATEQMADRNIIPVEVEQALDDPQVSYRSTRPGREDRTVILGVTATGRRLKVVVRAARPDFVVTVADRDEE